MAWNKLSTYKTKVCKVGDVLFHVSYHSTVIVMCYDHDGRAVVELNTGGYETVTTKRKMNQAANQFGLGFGVYQKKHRWYVTTEAGTYAFDDRTFVFDRATGVPVGRAIAIAA